MYEIGYAENVTDDFKSLRPAQRKVILDRIEVQLTDQRTRQTRTRKILVRLAPPWEHVEPVWELRIGEFRVFYDVDEAAAVVTIRAIRHKPPHKTTEEIL